MSKLSDIRAQTIEYIKTNDMFWLHDLKAHLNIDSSDPAAEMAASFVCRELARNQVLTPSERRGNNIQYMVTNPQN